MRQDGSNQNQLEVELKLSLLYTPLATLVKRLAQTQALRRSGPTCQLVHNIYYDTPAQNLRQQSAALRIRRTGVKTKHQWVQTLKTGDCCGFALSQRGEWEVPMASAKLSGDLSLTAAEYLERTPGYGCGSARNPSAACGCVIGWRPSAHECVARDDAGLATRHSMA